MKAETTKIVIELEKYTLPYGIVTLENKGLGQGEVTVKTNYFENSYYFGSMDSNIQDFMLRINSDYFANKLLPAYISQFTYCKKKTAGSVKAAIVSQVGLPWYKHLEFQKDMREVINSFCSSCESQEEFVHSFKSCCLDNFNYYLIEDRFERETLKEEMSCLREECWYLLGEKTSDQYKTLVKIHKDLQKAIRKHGYTSIK